MTKLTTHARNALPSSAFVFPKTRSYPIHDSNHARMALSDVAKSGNAAEKSAVRAAVARKYPDINQSSGTAGGEKSVSPANNMVQDKPSPGLVGT